MRRPACRCGQTSRIAHSLGAEIAGSDVPRDPGKGCRLVGGHDRSRIAAEVFAGRAKD